MQMQMWMTLWFNCSAHVSIDRDMHLGSSDCTDRTLMRIGNVQCGTSARHCETPACNERMRIPGMYERPGFAHLFCDAVVLVKELEERDLRHQPLVLEEGWRRHVQRQYHKRRGFLHGCRRARVSAAQHSAMPWRETGPLVSVRRRMDEDEGALVGRGNGGGEWRRRLRIVCHGRFAATTASSWALLVNVQVLYTHAGILQRPDLR